MSSSALRSTGRASGFRVVLTTAAAFALPVTAYLGCAGVATSSFVLAIGPGDTLLLAALLFLLYALVGLPVLIAGPLFRFDRRRGDASRRRVVHAMASVTAWAFLVLTFLPLKGTERFVRAGSLTTLQLNAIGLVVVFAVGLLAGLIIALLCVRTLALLRRRLTAGGMRVLGAIMVAAALATAAGGAGARSRPVALLRCERVGMPRVAVIAVDGCDWEKLEPLVSAGRVPTFERLMSGGCYGSMNSLDELVSPRIWTTIATGKTPDKHGIADFVNEEGVPVNSTMRRAAPFWDIVSAHGVTAGVVGWYVTWPADPINGFLISDRTHSLLRGAVQVLQSLTGDTTNERLERFGRFRFDPAYKSYPTSDKHYQQNRIVDEPLRWGYLRDLIYSQISTRLCERYEPTLTAVYFRGVDFVEHFFWQYADPEPFGTVTNAERRAYGGVIDNYYVYQDRMMARLLRAIGDDVNVIVVSDHGFQPRTDPPPDRPQLTGQHERHAVFIASGPAFRSSGRFEGATVYDVAPTVLAVMGIPVPEDMDGRVLTETILESHLERFPLRYIPSYEPAVGREREEVGSTMDESIREQLKSLGYIE